MKIRIGFVSNSSTASFVIEKQYLTEEQIKKIRNYQFYAKMMTMGNITYTDGIPEPCCGNFGYLDDNWSISEDNTTIGGYTIIDNFNMFAFLEAIGVDMNKVEKGE